jgi:Tfp pilus assembly protein PilN
MIKINLATRKQATGLGDGGGLKGLGALAAARNLDGLKELPLRKIALLLAVGIGASYLLDDVKQKELDKLTVQEDRLNGEKNRAMGELGKIKGFEEMKKVLDNDEFTLKTKIETIDKLLDDRRTPPKLLIELSKTIPPEVWLSDFKIEYPDVKITGSSLGFNQISDFMKNLNENVYFTELKIEKTEQGQSGFATFELKAKRR